MTTEPEDGHVHVAYVGPPVSQHGSDIGATRLLLVDTLNSPHPTGTLLLPRRPKPLALLVPGDYVRNQAINCKGGP